MFSKIMYAVNDSYPETEYKQPATSDGCVALAQRRNISLDLLVGNGTCSVLPKASATSSLKRDRDGM